MKYAFSTNAFTNYSLIESITEIASIGYSGVEIMCDTPHAYPPDIDNKEISKIKQHINSKKIDISNLNAFTLFALGDTYHPSWIENSIKERNERITHTKRCIDLARQLGAKSISIEPGGPIDPVQEAIRPKLLKIYEEGINKVLPYAEENKVKILIEPEPGMLIQSSKEYTDFLKNFDSRYLKLNFDIGHFYCVKEDPKKLVYELYDYIEHYHLADIKDHIHNHLIPGLGDIKFDSVIHAIEDDGYKGFVTVELYPYKSDPIAAAKESLNYLNNLFV